MRIYSKQCASNSGNKGYYRTKTSQSKSTRSPLRYTPISPGNSPTRTPMYFVELRKRLIAAARQRIRAGLVTERRLASLSGVSQPHMHNVLKEIRSLTFESADKVLGGLGLTTTDLFGNTEASPNLSIKSVPVLRAPIGPGQEAKFNLFSEQLPVPAQLVKTLMDPVLARLGPDLALPREFISGDLILLDQNPALRSALQIPAYWVIAEGSGLRVCLLRAEKDQVYIAGESDAQHPDGWRVLETRGRNPEQLLKARIVWLSRELAS